MLSTLRSPHLYPVSCCGGLQDKATQGCGSSTPWLATGQEGLVRKYGKAFMRLGWWEMHCAAQSALPDGVICFDSRFSRCRSFTNITAKCLELQSPTLWSSLPKLAGCQPLVGYQLHRETCMLCSPLSPKGTQMTPGPPVHCCTAFCVLPTPHPSYFLVQLRGDGGRRDGALQQPRRRRDCVQRQGAHRRRRRLLRRPAAVPGRWPAQVSGERS